MPRPQIDLDPFKAEIQLRIAAGQTQTKIRSWLAAKGIQIGKNTLSMRMVEWKGLKNRPRTASSNTTLLSAVDNAFHTTFDDD